MVSLNALFDLALQRCVYLWNLVHYCQRLYLTMCRLVPHALKESLCDKKTYSGWQVELPDYWLLTYCKDYIAVSPSACFIQRIDMYTSYAKRFLTPEDRSIRCHMFESFREWSEGYLRIAFTIDRSAIFTHNLFTFFPRFLLRIPLTRTKNRISLFSFFLFSFLHFRPPKEALD